MIRIGHDICNTDRFLPFLNKESFLRRIFGLEELTEAKSVNSYSTRYLAGRWAAKESLSKALGLGLFDWNLVEAQYVRGVTDSRRVWLFSGAMLEKVENYHIETSLSYEDKLASAVTIIVMK